MDNSVQIGLFFDQNYLFDPIIIASKLKTKIPELENGTTLPIDEKSNNPVIIFEKSKVIRLVMSFNHMMVTLLNDDDKFSEKTINSIMDILKKEDIKVSRIGYILNKVLGYKEAQLFRNNAFDHSELINSDEFQLSYYKLDKMNDMNINCWKRYFTEYENFIISFDINTIKEEQHNVNYKFILNFIKDCHEYIENNQIVNIL